MKIDIIFVVLLFLLIFPSCEKNKKEEMSYPVKINKVGNVIYVRNPDIPQNGLRRFSLKEELSIGNDTDDNYTFEKIKKIGIDSTENIYVLDSKKKSVKLFDNHGIFIRSFSNKGEGPGEIASPIDMAIDDKNKMINILDSKNRKISRYH